MQSDKNQIMKSLVKNTKLNIVRGSSELMAVVVEEETAERWQEVVGRVISPHTSFYGNP
jgi:hypothetical protein